MTGQRVSDEQFAEWLRQRGESWNVGMLAFDAVTADLRAAREENQQLQQRIEAALAVLRVHDSENARRPMAHQQRLSDVRLEQLRRVLSGGGSSD